MHYRYMIRNILLLDGNGINKTTKIPVNINYKADIVYINYPGNHKVMWNVWIENWKFKEK